MPNWCATNIVSYGDKKQVKELRERVIRICESACPVPNDFGNRWLGHIQVDFGYDWENTRCRGEISFIDVEEKDDFRIDQIDAWGPNVEMWETILKDHYPDVHLVYQADEPGCEIHINTDTKGEYFPDKYLLDISLSYKSPAKVPPGLTDGSNFFQTFDDLKKSVEVLTKRKFSNFIEIRNYIMDQTFDGYDFIGVYEYEGCCS